MTRPLGVYDPGPTPPAWAQIGTCMDTESDADLRQYARVAESRPFWWVLQLGFAEPPHQQIGPHARRQRLRLERLGLWKHVVAVVLGEEWYDRWTNNEFAGIGFPSSDPNGWRTVQAWFGEQHRQIRAEMPKKWIGWVTPLVSPTRPVPAHTDLVFVDAYVPDGERFDQQARWHLWVTEQCCPHDLVLVLPTFRDRGTFSAPLSDADTRAYLDWLGRPRYKAGIGFTWRSRPWSEVVGLDALPETQAALSQYAGGRE